MALLIKTGRSNASLSYVGSVSVTPTDGFFLCQYRILAKVLRIGVVLGDSPAQLRHDIRFLRMSLHVLVTLALAYLGSDFKGIPLAGLWGRLCA